MFRFFLARCHWCLRPAFLFTCTHRSSEIHVFLHSRTASFLNSRIADLRRTLQEILFAQENSVTDSFHRDPRTKRSLHISKAQIGHGDFFQRNTPTLVTVLTRYYIRECNQFRSGEAARQMFGDRGKANVLQSRIYHTGASVLSGEK